ncbi:MAG TPA: polysaccharide biosynthesis/export family protein [Myxococcota bacterium]|nr:polysaccharide biosynthesis/export family protein [Myxococcota bacterium]
MSGLPAILALISTAFSAETPAAPSGTYLVGPGDTLQVQVYGEGALSGSFPVNTAGELDYPLLGPVSVQGLDTTAVVALLRERLEAGYVRNPSINVWISTYRSQPVQVLGAVARPGIYFLQGPTTVLSILSEAGGVSVDGVSEVRISHNGTEEVLPYDQLLTQSPSDSVLSAGDVIFVPQSKVSVMGYVGKPGEIPYREDLTLSGCIAAAGGVLPTGSLGQVYILRGDQRIHVNLRRILNGKALDVDVQPGDRIFVQQSAV